MPSKTIPSAQDIQRRPLRFTFDYAADDLRAAVYRAAQRGKTQSLTMSPEEYAQRMVQTAAGRVVLAHPVARWVLFGEVARIAEQQRQQRLAQLQVFLRDPLLTMPDAAKELRAMRLPSSAQDAGQSLEQAAMQQTQAIDSKP